MGEYLGLAFFIATSLLGVIVLLDHLCVAFLREKSSVGEQVVYTFRGHVARVEYILRRSVLLGARNILIIDDGMDEETAEVVARFCAERAGTTVRKSG